jgi:hypothetical protein
MLLEVKFGSGRLFQVGELKIPGNDTRDSDVLIQGFPSKGEAV